MVASGLGKVCVGIGPFHLFPVTSDSLLAHRSNGSYVVLVIVETSLLMPLVGVTILMVYKS